MASQAIKSSGVKPARFALPVVCVASALSAAKKLPQMAVILFVGYPAWDAIANVFDAARQGGIARNPIATDAAFGGFYFLISGLWLAVLDTRKSRANTPLNSDKFLFGWRVRLSPVGRPPAAAQRAAAQAPLGRQRAPSPRQELTTQIAGHERNKHDD